MRGRLVAGIDVEALTGALLLDDVLGYFAIALVDLQYTGRGSARREAGLSRGGPRTFPPIEHCWKTMAF